MHCGRRNFHAKYLVISLSSARGGLLKWTSTSKHNLHSTVSDGFAPYIQRNKNAVAGGETSIFKVVYGIEKNIYIYGRTHTYSHKDTAHRHTYTLYTRINIYIYIYTYTHAHTHTYTHTHTHACNTSAQTHTYTHTHALTSGCSRVPRGRQPVLKELSQRYLS